MATAHERANSVVIARISFAYIISFNRPKKPESSSGHPLLRAEGVDSLLSWLQFQALHVTRVSAVAAALANSVTLPDAGTAATVFMVASLVLTVQVRPVGCGYERICDH
jgi:hypothetical protein